MIVATDDMRIAEAAFEFGAEVAMTSPRHPSGTDRIAEVAKNLVGFDIVLNVQGDEPFIEPKLVEKLADALRLVHKGGRAIDPQLAVAAWGDEDPLTDRERQVLRLAGEGSKSSDIAETLGLSAGTVRNYLSEAIGKLGAENRIEAYRAARQRGWL